MSPKVEEGKVELRCENPKCSRRFGTIMAVDEEKADTTQCPFCKEIMKRNPHRGL